MAPTLHTTTTRSPDGARVSRALRLALVIAAAAVLSGCTAPAVSSRPGPTHSSSAKALVAQAKQKDATHLTCMTTELISSGVATALSYRQGPDASDVFYVANANNAKVAIAALNRAAGSNWAAFGDDVKALQIAADDSTPIVNGANFNPADPAFTTALNKVVADCEAAGSPVEHLAQGG